MTSSCIPSLFKYVRNAAGGGKMLLPVPRSKISEKEAETIIKLSILREGNLCTRFWNYDIENLKLLSAPS